MSTESKSDFPAPPAFYKLYAPGAEGPPPPAPVVGSYTYFGTTDETVERDFVPKLPEKERIYTLRSDTLNEIKGQLRLLNRELVFGFAELIAAIADRPSQYARGLERILKLQINIQDLINQVRPHQARSTLQYTLQQQVEEKRKGIAKLRAQQEQCVELLSAVAGELEASVAAAGTDKAADEHVATEATEAGATAMDVER